MSTNQIVRGVVTGAFVLAISAVAGPALAQSVKGRVLGENNRPITEAQVTVSPVSNPRIDPQGAVTTSDGRFVVGGLQFGKWTVVVDDDIDIRDDFMVDWAMSYRVQPQRDVFVERDTEPIRLDPSVTALSGSQYKGTGSKLGIDATMKHEFPAAAMPPKQHLARIDAHWKEYGF